MGDKCDVLFVDYGNSDSVMVADMRPLPGSVPSIAQVILSLSERLFSPPLPAQSLQRQSDL